MALKFHAVKRKVLAGLKAGREQYFAQVFCGEAIGFDDLCERLTEHSSVTSGDVRLVLRGFERVMCQQLKMGNIIQLPELGNFRVSVGSRGAATEKAFRTNLMKKPRIIFTPATCMKQVCKDMSFQKVTVKDVEVKVRCTLPHP